MTGPGGVGTREKKSAPTIVPGKRRANGSWSKRRVSMATVTAPAHRLSSREKVEMQTRVSPSIGIHHSSASRRACWTSGSSVAQRGVLVGERADVGVGALHLLAAQTARINPQAAARPVGIVAEAVAVEPDVGEGELAAHDSGTSQSSRISRVIARISWRSSSIVVLPQYQ